MKGKIAMQIFSLLTVMGCVFFLGSQADSFTFTFGETMEFKRIPSDLPEEYSGPQTVQALMNVFDTEYNRVHLRTRSVYQPVNIANQANLQIMR